MPLIKTILNDFIKLDQFLKLIGAVQSGGDAKMIIRNGEVEVNGKVEIRRGRKLVAGDRVACNGKEFTVERLSGE